MTWPMQKESGVKAADFVEHQTAHCLSGRPSCELEVASSQGIEPISISGVDLVAAARRPFHCREAGRSGHGPANNTRRPHIFDHTESRQQDTV